MQERLKRALEMLESGQVKRILGWKQGDLPYNPEPAFFEKPAELSDFTYDSFCGSNLSKYLMAAGKKEGKTLVFLKPCDTFEFNQLVKEHQINREDVYIIRVSCDGKADIDKIRLRAPKVIKDISEQEGRLIVRGIGEEETIYMADVLLEKCLACKGASSLEPDEEEAIINPFWQQIDKESRFAGVKALESRPQKERFAFWQQELSRCIRCNACRNVCPVCTCQTCVFDSDSFEMEQKVAADTFEEQLFHLIRAYHVAGRCSDCGECTRVCPQHIPLHLLNRKLIKDINEFYGEYQAGMDVNEKAPLHRFTMEDIEPGEAPGLSEGGNG